jgi:hypothetical protein
MVPETDSACFQRCTRSRLVQQLWRVVASLVCASSHSRWSCQLRMELAMEWLQGQRRPDRAGKGGGVSTKQTPAHLPQWLAESL